MTIDSGTLSTAWEEWRCKSITFYIIVQCRLHCYSSTIQKLLLLHILTYSSTIRSVVVAVVVYWDPHVTSDWLCIYLPAFCIQNATPFLISVKGMRILAQRNERSKKSEKGTHQFQTSHFVLCYWAFKALTATGM